MRTFTEAEKKGLSELFDTIASNTAYKELSTMSVKLNADGDITITTKGNTGSIDLIKEIQHDIADVRIIEIYSNLLKDKINKENNKEVTQ